MLERLHEEPTSAITLTSLAVGYALDLPFLFRVAKYSDVATLVVWCLPPAAAIMFIALDRKR